jgi:hypothetical protein
MSLQRLTVCSMVCLSSLSLAAVAAVPHKSGIKSPLAATHHASYKPHPAKNQAPDKKKHFWDKK